MNLEDLKFYALQLSRQIREIHKNSLIHDAFFRHYVDNLIISHIEIIQDYIDHLEVTDAKKMSFIAKALRYHFNCIIDSFTFAFIAIQQEQ